MKKTKKLKKTHLALAVMVIALGAAVWLNMRYTSTGANGSTDTPSKYLGQAEYVNASVSENSSESKESDYFVKLRNDRKKARQEALDILEETLDRSDLTEAQKAQAAEKSAALAKATEDEAAIETILKAKGFADVVVVIGESDVNVIVSKTPDAAGVARIQDAVISHTDFDITDIKIISAQ